jgi:GxxExxY protein
MNDHGRHGEAPPPKDCEEQLINAVLTCLTNVHRHLGAGLFESVYELATMVEFEQSHITAKRQSEVPVPYRGRDLGIGLRADFIVEDCLLLELKTVDEFAPVHLAQMITYLKLLRLKRGFLINFNKALLKDGIKRVSI